MTKGDKMVVNKLDGSEELKSPGLLGVIASVGKKQNDAEKESYDDDREYGRRDSFDRGTPEPRPDSGLRRWKATESLGRRDSAVEADPGVREVSIGRDGLGEFREGSISRDVDIILKRDSTLRRSSKRDSIVSNGGKRDSGYVDKRDSFLSNDGRRDSYISPGEKRDSVISDDGIGRRDSVLSAVGKIEGILKTERSDSPYGTLGKKDSLYGTLDKKDSLYGTIGKKDSLGRKNSVLSDGRRDSIQGIVPRSSNAGILRDTFARAISPRRDSKDYGDKPEPIYDRGRRDSSLGKEEEWRSRNSTLERKGRIMGNDMDADKSEFDYNRGRRGSSVGKEAEWRKRNSTTEHDMNGTIEGHEVVPAYNRESMADESKHFLSLQIFSQHAEPALDEYLPQARQLELEHKQREEEDALYRRFLKERSEQEDNVAHMEEKEREELFTQMNLMERSRIINLADKHSKQMLDLIHREKVKYLEEGEVEDIEERYPREPPPVAPPQFGKQDVYENNMSVFEVVDEDAKQAAKEEYHTFTALVRFLVGRCTSDVEKARAIFRFITEKQFKHQVWFLFYPEEGNTRGAPTSLLRGVEFGIETKALLYKRMCAYAGLHAIVIKGYCKHKDYMPGEEFVDNKWRNAWNAVFVAGGWRLVQSNWAMLGVTTKIARETRQIYQDHYFLTDPDKFIFEFFPMKAEHQLLDHPISMTEFENLPLLRSTFMYFGLGLARSEGTLQAIINTNDRGEASIHLKSSPSISFHYTLTNFKNGSTSVKAAGGKFPLGRFVMMSTTEEETTFNMHVPSKGNYLMDISAAHYPTAQSCFSKEPTYYINVCKFKISCKTVDKLTIPLPDCVPGEWGPTKAWKLFGLKATSHPGPVIYAAPESSVDLQEDKPLTLNIEFEMTNPVLDFIVKLYKNKVKTESMAKSAKYRIRGQYVMFDIKVPQDGQYGLDIYTRENWDQKMLHCCKYLVNCDV